jgi:hypothetical protein
VSAQEGYAAAGNQAQADAIGKMLERSSDGTMRLKSSVDAFDEKEAELGTHRTQRLGES